MTNNLWIPHTGDKCPVDPDTVVEVMIAENDEPSGPSEAHMWNWGKAIPKRSIVLYRIVEQPKADWERFFEQWGNAGMDDFLKFTVNEFYEAIASRLKAEGLK